MCLRYVRKNYYVNKFPYGSLKCVGEDIKAVKEFLMKRKVVVLLVVGVVLFGVSAQRVDAQNNAQRIIGTWVDHQESTWVFNVDGTFTKSGSVSVGGKFVIVDTQLALVELRGVMSLFNISVSSDGRTLILNRISGNSQNIGGPYLLTKQ